MHDIKNKELEDRLKAAIYIYPELRKLLTDTIFRLARIDDENWHLALDNYYLKLEVDRRVVK